MRVRFPCTARYILSRVNFQCRLSHGVCTTPFAIACIYICAHVKDHVVHVRVQWITKTPSMHCRLGIATLSQLTFPGEDNHGRNPFGTIQLYKAKQKTKQKLQKKRKWMLREAKWYMPVPHKEALIHGNKRAVTYMLLFQMPELPWPSSRVHLGVWPWRPMLPEAQVCSWFSLRNHPGPQPQPHSHLGTWQDCGHCRLPHPYPWAQWRDTRHQ